MDGVATEDSTIEPVDAFVPPLPQRRGRDKPPAAAASSSVAAAVSGGDVRKTKNAVMLLNELQPGGLRYNGVTKSGPDHKPLYTASVTIYGQVGSNNYTGSYARNT